MSPIVAKGAEKPSPVTEASMPRIPPKKKEKTTVVPELTEEELEAEIAATSDTDTPSRGQLAAQARARGGQDRINAGEFAAGKSEVRSIGYPGDGDGPLGLFRERKHTVA